jgi:hypothetical protein
MSEVVCRERDITSTFRHLQDAFNELRLKIDAHGGRGKYFREVTVVENDIFDLHGMIKRLQTPNESAAQLERLDELVDGVIEELRDFLNKLADKLESGPLVDKQLPNIASLGVLLTLCRLDQQRRGWRRPTEN